MQNTEYVVVFQKISVDVSSILTKLSYEVYVVVLGGYCCTWCVFAVVRERTGVFSHPRVHFSHPYLNYLQFIVPLDFVGPTSAHFANTQSSESSSVQLRSVSRRLRVSLWRPSSVSHLSVYSSHYSNARKQSTRIGKCVHANKADKSAFFSQEHFNHKFWYPLTKCSCGTSASAGGAEHLLSFCTRRSVQPVSTNIYFSFFN